MRNMKGTSSKKEKSVITAKKCDNSKKKSVKTEIQEQNMVLGTVLGTGEDCNRRSLSLLMIWNLGCYAVCAGVLESSKKYML